jgi:hypothetical protein
MAPATSARASPASASDLRAASRTQWCRWSLSSPAATSCRARVAEATWVITSGHQAPDLAFDLPQPPQVVVLAGGVAANRARRGAGPGRRMAPGRATGGPQRGGGVHGGLPVPAGDRWPPHIRPACQNAPCPPYQNIITTIPLADWPACGYRIHAHGPRPWGAGPSVPARKGPTSHRATGQWPCPPGAYRAQRGRMRHSGQSAAGR